MLKDVIQEIGYHKRENLKNGIIQNLRNICEIFLKFRVNAADV
jgi:hypothetical protein